MTLNEIRNLVLAAIDKSDLTITGEKINDQNHGSPCVKQVLRLLRSDNGITFTPLAVTLNPPTRLVIEGTTSILDRGNLATKIILADADSRPRACQIEVDDFRPCAPKELADKNLFTIPESIRTFEVFESRFAEVKLRASSDVEVTALSITGKNTTATDLVILVAPEVKLRGLGFVLENFLFQRMNSPEARFRVTGNFIVNAGGRDNDIAGEVEIPVANTSVPGRWRVKFEAVGNPLPIAPNDIATWVGATGAFGSFPAEILPLSDFGLKGFTLSLDGRRGNITAVEFVISTSKVWTFTQGFGLSNIAVIAEIVPPFASPILSLYGRARFTIGTLTLDCVIGLQLGSSQCFLSFSTPQPFRLSELAGLPGGAVLNQLGLPPTERPIEVNLADLTFVLDLKAPEKLKSIRLNVRTNNFEWRLIPDFLSLSNPQLYVELTGSVRGWQVNQL